MKQRPIVLLFAVLLLAGQVLPGYALCVCDSESMPMACCTAPQEPPPCCGAPGDDAARTAGPVIAPPDCERDLALSDFHGVTSAAPEVHAAPVAATPFVAAEPAPALVATRVVPRDDPSPPGPPVFLLHAALLI